jgi:hypothetical protein
MARAHHVINIGQILDHILLSNVRCSEYLCGIKEYINGITVLLDVFNMFFYLHVGAIVSDLLASFRLQSHHGSIPQTQSVDFEDWTSNWPFLRSNRGRTTARETV